MADRSESLKARANLSDLHLRLSNKLYLEELVTDSWIMTRDEVDLR